MTYLPVKVLIGVGQVIESATLNVSPLTIYTFSEPQRG
jgi:hypothetical protein